MPCIDTVCSVTTHVADCKQVDELYTFSESWKNIYTNKIKTIENERKINRPEIWEAKSTKLSAMQIMCYKSSNCYFCGHLSKTARWTARDWIYLTKLCFRKNVKSKQDLEGCFAWGNIFPGSVLACNFGKRFAKMSWGNWMLVFGAFDFVERVFASRRTGFVVKEPKK